MIRYYVRTAKFNKILGKEVPPLFYYQGDGHEIFFSSCGGLLLSCLFNTEQEASNFLTNTGLDKWDCYVSQTDKTDDEIRKDSLAWMKGELKYV